MRVLIGALLLWVCASGSAHRLTAWRSDQALLTAAVQTTPRYPHAALLLGAAYVRLGQWDAAAAWTIRAALLSEGRPDYALGDSRGTFRQAIGRQLTWIDAFQPVCDQPLVQPWCAW